MRLRRSEPAWPLVGRQADLDRLRVLLDGARAGSGAAIFVEGEPGIGKSRLLAAMAGEAAAQGFVTACGSADELGRTVPFGTLTACLAAATAPALRAMAELPVGDGEFAVIEALVAALEAEALRGPVLLAVDDLHWADPATLLALRAIGRRLTGLPLVVTGSLRPTPRVAELDLLLSDQWRAAQMVELHPLSETESAELAGAVVGGTLGPGLRAQVARAGGNALFVIELVHALRDEGALTLTGGAADTTASELPRSLRIVLVRRLGLLPDEVLELLQIAATLGSTFSLVELCEITGRPATRLLGPLRAAIGAGVLGEANGQLVFRHPMLREAIYTELPAGARMALHREAGKALAAVGAPAVRVAEQLYLGAIGDASVTEATARGEAVDWLRRAARQAAPASVPLAVDLLGRAVELIGPTHADRPALLAELAPLLVLCGRLDEAEALTEPLLANPPDAAIESRLRVGMAQALARRGRWRTAARQIRAAAATQAMAPGALIRLVAGDAAGAHTWADEARVVAERTGHQVMLSTALMTLSWTTLGEGQPAVAEQLAEAAVRAAEAASSPSAGFLFPHLTLGAVLLDADRFTEAHQTFDAGIQRAERLGAASLLPYYHSGLAIGRFHCGDWDDAVSDAEAAVTLADESGTRWTLMARAVAARVAMARGDLGTAEALVDTEMADLVTFGPVLGVEWLLWVRALLLEAQGRSAEAASEAIRCWHTLPEVRGLIVNRQLAPDLVRLALAGGNRTLAEAVIEDSERRARARHGLPSAAAVVARCRGLFNGDIEALSAAVELLRGGPCVADLAYACTDASKAMAVAGHRERARALLDEALGAFESLGAARDAAQAAAALRGLGVRRGVPGRRGRPSHGWPSLTPTELKVVGMVVEGMSNPNIAQRLFISRRTVETHLQHVYSKLGMSCRAELAAAGARRTMS